MNARLQQLEQKYTALDAQIAESPVKQALSILHAMVHEVRREAGTSPGCSQQLDLYQHDLAEFTQRGAILLGISVDSIYSHGAWAAVRGITFPLLADFHPKGAVAQSYRVYRDRDGFSERALYVVDADGVIRYSHVSPFLNHVPDIRELLGALDRAASPSPAQVAA